MSQSLARFGHNVGAAMKIVLLGVGASVAYGILQDQVTAHVCVEYFTIGHVDFLNLGNPTWIAFEWGFVATWWAGLLLGLPVALLARAGTRRPRLSARDLLRPTLLVLCGVGVVALVAGVTGYFVAKAGGVYLTEPLASAVPRARQVAFLADLWAHDAAYLAGALGAVVLCVWTWRRRSALRRYRRNESPLELASAATAQGATIDRQPAPHRWERVTLRVLLVIGAVSVVLGFLFILVISTLSGL